MTSVIDNNGRKSAVGTLDEEDRKRHRECVNRILKDLENVKNYDGARDAVIRNTKYRFRENSKTTDEDGIVTTVWDCSHRFTDNEDYQITERNDHGRTSSLRFGNSVTGVVDPIKHSEGWVIFNVTDGKVSILASLGELPDITVIETDKSGKEKQVSMSELKARGEAESIEKAAAPQTTEGQGAHVKRLNSEATKPQPTHTPGR